MKSVINGYRGLSFFVGLNADLMFMLATILVGLLAGTFVSSFLAASF